jgi:signal transduction histidine kinase
MRSRVEAGVRAELQRAIAAASAAATDMGAIEETVRAKRGESAAIRSLFERVARLVERHPGTASAAIYDRGAGPVAWAGRPSDIPSDRLRARGEQWFAVESALGLRLVHVRPSARTDVLVVTERDLASVASPSMARLGPGTTARYQTPTRWAPVWLEPSVHGARTTRDPSRFDIDGPDGRPLLTALVEPEDLRRTRTQWASATRWVLAAALAVAVLAMLGALLDWRVSGPRGQTARQAVLLVSGILVTRGLLLWEPIGSWASWPVATGVAYASSAVPRLMASPLDALLSALALAGLSGVALMAAERRRRTRRRLTIDRSTARIGSALAGLIAGAMAAALMAADAWLIADTVSNATVDVLHLSLSPLSPPRTALHLALVLLQAAITAGLVTLFRLSTARWLVGLDVRILPAVVGWLLPSAWWALAPLDAHRGPMLVLLVAASVLTLALPTVWVRYRNGSQAFRLLIMALALVVPALASYPALYTVARRAKSDLVEARYAPQAISQRKTVYALLDQSTHEIDAVPDLVSLVTLPAGSNEPERGGSRAFQIWRGTALARFPVTSSVEVYNAGGDLVSRFAFNLPEDLNAVPRGSERSCAWTRAEEVSPFFAEERRVYHAGRAICAGPDATPLGSVVVHAMLDYENLPFTAPRTPYVQALSAGDSARGSATPGDDLQYAVYGWSRTPLYSSQDTAWPLDDAVFALVEQSRDPVWATLRRDGIPFDVYLLNDRGGIYALGFPSVSWLGHLLNIAELTTIAALTFLGLAFAGSAVLWAWRRVVPAQTLLREIRAGFYRKLFLAFVAAVVAPVALLAVVARTFVANEMRGGVEREAIRTSAAASRVVADLIAPQASLAQNTTLDDNLMVWVRRLVNEDANIYIGTSLEATSERTIFAAGLLSTRTPSPIYRAIAVNREAGSVARERIGAFEYVVAASPIRLGSVDAMMTVPLTARQREIDARIEALDRRVLLAALAFMLAGAGLGYTMAERIADPVNRLTRATRRLARGDFAVQVVSTSSDELARLVVDFNRMATELERQRGQLERTHRLEAWAEMARQVAHDIKNPLTPIQLNAEHLKRVHGDRGEPLGGVVPECVDAILTQVALLRQIASEFSNFASSPAVRPSEVSPVELVTELLEPYRRGRPAGITIELETPSFLPAIHVDRALIARALTNIIENGLHAMPTGGILRAALRQDGVRVVVSVADTGGGMDAEALARAFEPYFSTKVRGTGLGLPIAKRNVELCGGSLDIASEFGRGTTVEIRLPMAPSRTG